MIVTAIRQQKRKYHIEIDNQPAFFVYQPDCDAYSLSVGQQLEEAVWLSLSEKAIRRCRQRSLYILDGQAYSAQGLRQRLKREGYQVAQFEPTLIWLEAEGYLDDWRYAKQLIDRKKRTTGQRQLYAYLVGKGLSSEIVKQSLVCHYSVKEDEAAAVLLLSKQNLIKWQESFVRRQKALAYLGRKGFSYEVAQRAFQKVNKNLDIH